MKPNGWISGIAAIVVCGGIAGSAQSTPSSAGQSDQKSITVTGCLQPASAAGTTGTSGTTAAGTTSGTTSSSSTANDRFMLMNARMGSGMSSSSTSSTGGTTTGTTAGTTSGTMAGGAAGASYTLEGKTSDLRNHVNHQVEITGRLDSSSTTAGGASTAGSTTASTSTSGSGRTSSDAQKIQVESVKMIAATCAGR